MALLHYSGTGAIYNNLPRSSASDTTGPAPTLALPLAWTLRSSGAIPSVTPYGARGAML